MSLNLNDSVRYCPRCGYVGEVPAGYTTCCLTSESATYVPRVIALQARACFKLRKAEDLITHLENVVRSIYRKAEARTCNPPAPVNALENIQSLAANTQRRISWWRQESLEESKDGRPFRSPT